jgi:hypothetical protein
VDVSVRWRYGTKYLINKSGVKNARGRFKGMTYLVGGKIGRSGIEGTKWSEIIAAYCVERV